MLEWRGEKEFLLSLVGEEVGGEDESILSALPLNGSNDNLLSNFSVRDGICGDNEAVTLNGDWGSSYSC